MADVPQLIQSVSLALLDGRSVKLRLNQAGAFRASLASGIDASGFSELPKDQQFDFMLRILYESSSVRRTMKYDEFEDALDIPKAMAAFPELMGRFSGKARASQSDPPAEGPSTGSSDGPSEEVSASVPQSSGV